MLSHDEAGAVAAREPREVWQHLEPAESEPPYNPDSIKPGAKVTVTLHALRIDFPADFFRNEGRAERLASVALMINHAMQAFALKHGG